MALAVFIVLSSQGAATAADDSEPLAGRPLVAALRSGGLIVYFRHAATDLSQNDAQMTGYEDCARQRNLTEHGRDQARAIGVAVTRLTLPIGEVMASPYCRTMETARLIFGRATASPAVQGFLGDKVPTERYAPLRQLLSTAPAPGTDLAIVGHGIPFQAVAGEVSLAEGEAAVIRPLGVAGFRIVARIPAPGWSALAGP